ncbi:hypothetical protein ACFWVM_18500 [Nocardia fluminea]
MDEIYARPNTPDLQAKIADAVNAADQEQLRRWTTRFATATSLNDMRIA